MVTAYSQRDTEWAHDGLGTDQQLTLGQAGCLVTSIASVVADLTGESLSPGLFNDWLRANKGFKDGNLFIFDSVAPLGLRRVRSIYASTTAAPIADLTEALKAGHAVIVQVDIAPGGKMDQHWVRLLSVDEKDGQIMDPWKLPGQEFVPLSTYFAPGWDPARAIFTAHIYQAEPPTRWILDTEAEAEAEAPRRRIRRAIPAPEDVGPHQPALCLRPPD